MVNSVFYIPQKKRVLSREKQQDRHHHQAKHIGTFKERRRLEMCCTLCFFLQASIHAHRYPLWDRVRVGVSKGGNFVDFALHGRNLISNSVAHGNGLQLFDINYAVIFPHQGSARTNNNDEWEAGFSKGKTRLMLI